MTNRIGGASPDDPSKKTDPHQQHRRIEKVEKIKSVEETENESRMRQKFQNHMKEETDQGKKQPPGPMETSFYQKKQPSLGDIAQQKQPGPRQNSAPPKPRPSQTSAAQTSEPQNESPLPRRKEFWSNTDKDQKGPHLEENATSLSEEKKAELLKQEEMLLFQEESTFADEKEPLSQKGAVSKKEAAKTKQEEEMLVSSSLPNKADPISAPEETKTEESAKKAKGEKEGKEILIPEKTSEKMQQAKKEKDDREEKEEQQKTVQETLQIASATPNALPTHAVAAAEVATSQAASFLSPEAAPVFFHMVGSIHMMVSPSDISRTEVLLNSPSFATSKFFGAQIIIERYAIAPDSFNIRLTGSNEAVTAFQQNIPNLYAAFEKGNYSFQIGRIEAEYKTERALFRRKSPSKGPDDMGDDGSSQQQGK